MLTPDAVVPERISLAWYKDKERGRSARAEAVPQPVSAGERWQLTTRLKRPHGTINPHGFDFEQWALEHNLRASGYVRKSDRNIRLEEMVDRPSYRVERLRQEIRERFLDILAGNDYAGILVALAVGDQRAIPPEQWQILTRTGVNHLMSISGLHVTMVSGLIFSLVYGLWRRSHRLTLWLPARKAAAIAGVAAALGYALLAGFAVPAQRTVYMLAAIAIALWLGRSISMTAVLAWALLAVVVIDPWSVLSAGFWLSFGAIAVILLVSAGRVGRMHWLTGWARVQWAITLGLIPLLLAMFQQVSLVSPFANAIAIPLVSLVVVPLTLLATLPPLDVMLFPAHWMLSGCMQIMQWMSDVPQAVWSQHAPPAWAVVAGMAGICWMLLPGEIGPRFSHRLSGPLVGRSRAVAALSNVAAQAGSRGIMGDSTGCGSGISGSGTHAKSYAALRYGTGLQSGSRQRQPHDCSFLRGEGVRHVHAMVVTHADADHSGGALSVLQAVPVDRLVSSLKEDHPIQLAAAKTHQCRAGESWQWDGVRFDMLHPSEQSYSNPRLKTNALSCVMKITTSHGSVLLPADIEKRSEYQLVEHDGRCACVNRAGRASSRQ